MRGQISSLRGWNGTKILAMCLCGRCEGVCVCVFNFAQCVCICVRVCMCTRARANVRGSGVSDSGRARALHLLAIGRTTHDVRNNACVGAMACQPRNTKRKKRIDYGVQTNYTSIVYA